MFVESNLHYLVMQDTLVSKTTDTLPPNSTLTPIMIKR